MAYRIEIGATAMAELEAMRVFDSNRIVDAIDQNLQYEPGVATRNRKPLPGVAPNFEHVPPVWELRVGAFRVFYDFDESTFTVNIRAVRKKPPHATTGEIL